MIGLLLIAVALFVIGGFGLETSLTSLRCATTRDPVCDWPMLGIAAITILLALWILAQTFAAAN